MRMKRGREDKKRTEAVQQIFEYKTRRTQNIHAACTSLKKTATKAHN